MVESPCPLTNKPCRHCSQETITRPATILKPMKGSTCFENGGRTSIVQQLGAFCNNFQMWVVNMRSCPSGAVVVVDTKVKKKRAYKARSVQKKVVAKKKMVPKKKVVMKKSNQTAATKKKVLAKKVKQSVIRI